jgi:isoquinoline 1-oxidoreductase subunit alpha
MATNFTVNGKAASTDAPPATPLLWVIREHLKLTGTKFGCGAGLCGACMVHVDGKRAFWLSRCRNAATASPARS